MSIVNADERQKGQEDRSMKSHERQKEQGGWPEDGGGGAGPEAHPAETVERTETVFSPLCSLPGLQISQPFSAQLLPP